MVEKDSNSAGLGLDDQMEVYLCGESHLGDAEIQQPDYDGRE